MRSERVTWASIPASGYATNYIIRYRLNNQNVSWSLFPLHNRQKISALLFYEVDIWPVKLLIRIKPLSKKGTSWHVLPSKTQISLCIHAVWSESSTGDLLIAKRPTFLQLEKLRLWSDHAVVQTDLNLHCTHLPTCTLCWIPTLL